MSWKMMKNSTVLQYLFYKYNQSSNNTFNGSEWTYNTTFGEEKVYSEWETLTITVFLSTIILGTIFGNMLVILGVFTHGPLRIVQNFFIVSLAVADLAVAVLVMPLNVAYSMLGRWLWGKHLCKMWLTCDIMSCTSSILNLCAIALDRYWAITDPINYANKRTLRRVLLQITGIWTLSLLISSPPLLGWNDWPAEFTADTPCQLTSERSYVVYSSLGSFFIPLIIMATVYVKIFIAAKQRLRKRAAHAHKLTNVATTERDSQENKIVSDNDSESGESIKRSKRKSFMDAKKNLFMPFLLVNDHVSRQKIESEMNVMNDGLPKRYKRVVGSIKRLSHRNKKNEKPLLASMNSSGNVINKFIEQKQKISLSKERRAARTLGIIMGVFVICWLPFFTMYVALPFCPHCCPNITTINVITWLGYVNSTINPIIYTIFNLDFRKAFKKLLGCK